ncbi:MAG: hypothetical protein ACRDHN_17635, partial [Thermomicrobiales bacterium]
MSRYLIVLVILLAALGGFQRNAHAAATYQDKCHTDVGDNSVCRSFASSSAYYGSVKYECLFFDSDTEATTGYRDTVEYWKTAKDAKLVELDFYFGQQAAGIRFRDSGNIIGILVFRIDVFECVWSYQGGVDPFLFSTFE